MDYTLHTLILLLVITLNSTAANPSYIGVNTYAADPPEKSHVESCSDELVSFSKCLSYVALSPNNITDSPSTQCCDVVSDSFSNGSAICLCYFNSRPDIFGFPINSTKVLSLTSLCPAKEGYKHDKFFLQRLCSGSTALPPLHSITGPGRLPPPPPPTMESSSSEGPASSVVIPEPSDDLPDQPHSSPLPVSPSLSSDSNSCPFPHFHMLSVLISVIHFHIIQCIAIK